MVSAADMTVDAGQLASTPPMGWNSWDCYGTTVTEAEVLANALAMCDRLLASGWNTVVVDTGWFDPTARAHGYNENAPLELDSYGRLVPDPVRFPSAAGGVGFRALADSLHGIGLRFGLHVMRGIPRRAAQLDLPIHGTNWTASEIADREDVCAWNPDNYGLNHDHPGAQAYYDAQFAQFAQWGVDYVKVDDVLAPYRAREIEAISAAIGRSGRPMVLSLSPGKHLSPVHLAHLTANAQMWRISDDVWDIWDDVHAQFARLARWAPHQQPGAWADADMLPLGRIGLRAERGEPRSSRLTPDEQKTMLTLWAMARSPLMIGADLPTTDEATLDLLANPALREVLEESTTNRELLREPDGDGEMIVWSARSISRNRDYIAVFWTGKESQDISLPVDSLVTCGTQPSSRIAVNLWTGETVSTTTGGRLAVRVPSHGVHWVTLDPA